MSQQIGFNPKRRLGDLLVAERLITDEDLQRALAEQRGTGERLGSILVRSSLITDEQLLRFLSEQYHIPAITPGALDVDRETLRLVPGRIARKYDVVPLRRRGSSLTLAMADPTNGAALDDVAFVTNLQIVPVVASQVSIRTAIERYYAAGSAIEELETPTAETTSETSADASATIELTHSADDAPVVRLVSMVLTDAIAKGASDVHWEPYDKAFRIRFRIDGVLHEMLSPPKRLEPAIISRLKIMSNLDISERRLPQDGRIRLRAGAREVDFRVSTLPTMFGEKAVLRILDKEALKLDLTQLGFDASELERFKVAIHQPYGMVLITGPTGSGKTTTLYSAIHAINSPEINIMTAEDPVEYNLKGVNQVQVHEAVGRTFAAALRSFLRQDPDVILVGEMRDLDTAQIAIRAALTGHLVFSTLHTNDCASSIARLTDMGVAPFLLLSSLVLIVAQRLGRRVCQACREPYEVDEAALIAFGHVPAGAGKLTVSRGKGCHACNFTGLRGRVAIYEIMTITEAVRHLILTNAGTVALRETAQAEGMRTLRQAGLAKVLDGTTTLDEVLRITLA